MKLFSNKTKDPERPAFLATHDSATGMVMALSDFLKNKAFEGVGAVPTSELYAKFINSIPRSLRRFLYSKAGEYAAFSAKRMEEIDGNDIDRWIYEVYPDKKYPAIAIGSSNGAMIHFCAAMGIPWLPQTFLIPIDKGKKFPIDEPKKTMEWAKEPADKFLKKNPNWQLHHMMDPNQDRLRVDSVGYFRVKKLELGRWYEKFIEERLEPGGKLILIDCQLQWPVHKMGERHFFQFGGLGGLEPEEYYTDNDKVRNFLLKANSEVENWDSPEPNPEVPEAEWGLAQALAEDVKLFSEGKKLSLEKIPFSHPQSIAASMAEVFRKWYRKEGFFPDRLLVESFNVLSPFLCLKKRCVPYWLFFNVDMAADQLERFLDQSEAFDEIYMMILSHGKHSAGITPISRWEKIMKRAKKKHSFVGTTPEEYPIDMAMYARYSRSLRRTIEKEHPLPPRLGVDDAFEWLSLETTKPLVTSRPPKGGGGQFTSDEKASDGE